jgi:hypothetical protein
MTQIHRSLGMTSVSACMVVCAAGCAATKPAGAPPVPSPTIETIASRELSPGVEYRHVIDKSGPLVMHLLRVDLRRADLELRHLRAHDELKGREKVSSMVRRVGAGARDTILAAINADFFDLKTGETENNQVLGGEWWKGLKVTDSPYDTYDNVHVQFAVDSARRPYIDRYILDGKAWGRSRVATPITTVNRNPAGLPEGVALYTPRFGATTPRDTARPTTEAAMMSAGRRGDTLLFVRRGDIVAASGSPIPANGATLAGYGDRAKEVSTMAAGDTIKILLSTLPRSPFGAPLSLVIGGWPRILSDGVDVAVDAATVEGTIARNAEARHPRTAIGFSRDSTTLFLLVVEGRSQRSVGVSLVELAAIMRRLGAWQAMNFDGGGSTTMVVGGTVVNVPSDPTGEREVGSALALVRKR